MAPKRPGWLRKWPGPWKGFSAAVLSGSESGRESDSETAVSPAVRELAPR
jgi:hypothetical protein